MKYGISQTVVSEVLARVRAEMTEPDRQSLVQQSLDQLAEIRERSMEIVDMAGCPVTVGKDGSILWEDLVDERGLPVLDDEGNPRRVMVRDYSARLAALKVALATDEQLARRLGLSAAQKIESTSTVKYVVEGVDTTNLT